MELRIPLRASPLVSVDVEAMGGPEATRGEGLTEAGAQRLAGDVFFAPFRLDAANGRLWCGATELAIRPKAFAVLRHLAANPGRVVTGGELAHAVWAGSAGSAPLVKGCIRELRVLLNDEADSPRYVETVGRRGYRFVAPVAASPAVARPAEPAALFVGRRGELEQLDSLLATALAGKRQLVLLSGEPGIGKTVLAERFLNFALCRTEIRLGRGRCVEHSGTAEPYLPVLEALGRMCRGYGGERALAVLDRYAPTWLTQLSPLISEAQRDALRARIAGATRERMLREMCETAEALAAERPLVLWLDDLQWSDPSTIDLLTSLARRAERARLLVIGTYRPAEVVVSRHPLRAARHGLVAAGLCRELALGFLSNREVEDYLALRFPANDLRRGFSTTLLEITGGNPLFLSALVEDLVERGVIVEEEERWQFRGRLEALGNTLPDTLRHLIDQQVERLASEEQRILEAASVAGREFTAGAVGAALGIDADEADTRLETLVAQTQLVEARGIDSSPAGRATSGRYAFVHALYQRALYDRLPSARRARLHRRLGEAQEAAWGDRCEEIASELALHFERGGVAQAAIRYLRFAAENAARKFAGREATAHLEHALDLVEKLPRPDRNTEELTIRMALGLLLMTQLGASAGADSHYRRAIELSARIGNAAALFPSMRGLQRISVVRTDFSSAFRLARKCLAIARNAGEKKMLLEARFALGDAHFWRGELGAARKNLEQGLRLRAAAASDSSAFQHEDPGVATHSHLAIIAAFQGRDTAMREHVAEGQRIARRLGAPLTIAFALSGAAIVHQILGDASAVLANGEALLTFAAGVPFLQCFRGYGKAVAKGDVAGVDEVREGLHAWRATGAQLYVPYLLGLLAEAQAATGDRENARATVRDALAFARRTGERLWEAALLRLEGELLAEASRELRGSRRAKTQQEACAKLRQAAAVARRQGAAALVERARDSLKRLA